MRTGFSSHLNKVCWIFPLIVLLIGSITTSVSAATRSVSIATDEHMAKEVPGFSKFTGFWYAHGASLTVKENGQAHFEARVYIWCAPEVKQPCDSFQGNTIINGFKAD